MSIIKYPCNIINKIEIINYNRLYNISFNENNDIIDDTDIVGLNVVNLIKQDIMLEFFAQQINAQQFWFKQQFESYMFKGKSLYEFVEPNMKAFYGMMLAAYDGKLNEVVKVEEIA